jgi:L-ascorbate metabolism protein UlaG (beta-lactamase superfamily)
MRALPLLLALACASLPAEAHDPGQAKYLGNEGVLVARGDTKILFDAFYAESFDGTYALVPGSLESQMMKGEKPFDGVDAIFISHIHPDHFNSRKTIAYLRQHPNVQLYAGIDVVGAIRAADAAGDPLMKRVTRVHIAPGGPPARFSVGRLEIEAFPIPHSGGQPGPHFAYRVTLDGAATVMHLGDSDAAESHYVPYQADLDRKKTHLAFAPVWMLLDESGRRVLEQRIRPSKVVGIHVEAKAQGRPEDARKEANADLFIELGETRQIPVERP